MRLTNAPNPFSSIGYDENKTRQKVLLRLLEIYGYFNILLLPRAVNLWKI